MLSLFYFHAVNYYNHKIPLSIHKKDQNKYKKKHNTIHFTVFFGQIMFNSRYAEYMVYNIVLRVIYNLLIPSTIFLLFILFISGMGIFIDQSFISISILLGIIWMTLFVFNTFFLKFWMRNMNNKCNEELNLGIQKTLLQIEKSANIQADNAEAVTQMFSNMHLAMFTLNKYFANLIIGPQSELIAFFIAFLIIESSQGIEWLKNKIFDYQLRFETPDMKNQFNDIVNMMLKRIELNDKQKEIVTLYLDSQNIFHTISFFSYISHIIYAILILVTVIVEMSFYSIKSSSIDQTLLSVINNVRNIKNLSLQKEYSKHVTLLDKRFKKIQMIKIICKFIGYSIGVFSVFIVLLHQNKILINPLQLLAILPDFILSSNNFKLVLEEKIDGLITFIKSSTGLSQALHHRYKNLPNFLLVLSKFGEQILKHDKHVSQLTQRVDDKSKSIIINLVTNMIYVIVLYLAFNFCYVLLSILLSIIQMYMKLMDFYKQYEQIQETIWSILFILNLHITNQKINYDNLKMTKLLIEGEYFKQDNQKKSIKTTVQVSIPANNCIILLTKTSKNKTGLFNALLYNDHQYWKFHGSRCLIDINDCTWPLYHMTISNIYKFIYYIPQNNTIDLNLSIYDLFCMHGIKNIKVINSALELVHLSKLIPLINDPLGKNAATISSGQLQLILISIFLCRTNCIGIFDEAFFNLDPKYLKDILEQLILQEKTIIINDDIPLVSIQEIVRNLHSNKQILVWSIDNNELFSQEMTYSNGETHD